MNKHSEKEATALIHAIGLDAFVDDKSKILILGSFPSVKSRNVFYYNHPRNRFWGLLAKAFGESTPDTVENKKAFLTKHNIALWDVISECDIVGSQDSKIKNAVPSEIDKLVENYDIQKILVNGKRAEKEFKLRFSKLEGMAVFLPSTSPANVHFDEEQWLKALEECFL